MKEIPVHLLLALALSIFLSGCVEHAGATQGMKALEKGDITMCNGLKEQKDANECYYTFADGKNDPNYCLKGPDPAACVSDYAGKRQLMSPCDILKDPVQRAGCIARVAGDYTGRSVEEIIADFNSKGASKKCLEKCSTTQSSCEVPCELNKKYLPSYEQDGMIVYPTDMEYVNCKNACKDGYINCREDCLTATGGKDPYFS